MGNCATIYKSKEPTKKVECSIIQGNCNVQMESSIKEIGVNGHLCKAGIGSVPPRDSGNPEEMFFDSHALLDSDCEDFVSVGGDFTPSSSHGGGTTPIHNSFREAPPPPGKESESSSSSPPAADPKKQLIELLCESFRSDDHDHDHRPSTTPPHDDGNHNQLNMQEKVEAKLLTFSRSPKHAADGSSRPCNELLLAIGSPVCLSQLPTPNAISNPDDSEREKATLSTHGCLPNLLRNLSFSERKKKRLSHACGGGVVGGESFSY